MAESATDKKVKRTFGFGKNKASAAETAGDGSVKEKKKRFSRVRGLFKGRSRKSKTGRRSSNDSISLQSNQQDGAQMYALEDDDDTFQKGGGPGRGRDMLQIPEEALEDLEEGSESEDLYGEDNNNKNRKSSLSKKGGTPSTTGSGSAGIGEPLIQVVLLLIDPATRRFELLQLEFDSEKAKVSDTLTQVPKSVTEDAIRKQKYRGVCDSSSNEHGLGEKLMSFVKGKQILVGIPNDLKLQDCIRLARPILGDEKVSRMVRTFSIFQSGKKEAQKAIFDDFK
jgi:hypothetical protein